MIEQSVSRRNLLRGSSAIAAGMLFAPPLTATGSAVPAAGKSEQSNDGILYHYDESYDYNSVMQGSPPPPSLRITVANYRSNQTTRRWAHTHMREIFPTQNISRGCTPLSVLPRKVRDLDDLPIRYEDGEELTLKQHLSQNGTDAFLVLHRGAIVTEQYFHGMRPDTPHNVYSLGKSLSVGVLFNLLEIGKLSEQAAVTQYIPEWKNTAYEGATVRHLMDMQSGVFYDYEPPEMKTWHKHASADGSLPRSSTMQLDSGEYDFLANEQDFKTLIRPHGTVFYYKESDARGLIWACEKIMKRRFVDLFSEFIWSALGTEHDAYVCCDSCGAASTSSRISVTLRDLARWGEMHLHGGVSSGRRVLPQHYIDDILKIGATNRIVQASFPGPRHGLRHIVAYRNQYPIPAGDTGDFFAAGYNGQYCYISPASQAVIVKFSTHGDDTENDLWKYDQRDVTMCQQVVAHLRTAV